VFLLYLAILSGNVIDITIGWGEQIRDCPRMGAAPSFCGEADQDEIDDEKMGTSSGLC